MKAEDREPGEKPRRANPTGDDAPVTTGDNPTNPPGGVGSGGSGGGGGNGGGNHGGNHGGGDRGGGHHGGDNDPNHHHRDRGHDGHDGHDGDRDHHRHHRRHDNSSIYQNDNQNVSQNNGAARNVDECDRGYDDGLYTGANDARRGQPYDPQRSHFYKRGGGGLFSIGRSDVAKQNYRDCFLRGYEEGFHNYQQYFSGGSFHK